MESISQLNDTNIKQICRTCLTINTEEMISIFDEVENNETLKTQICEILLDVALIDVNTSEYLPTLICCKCLQLTQLLFDFRKQCNRSQGILLAYLADKENNVIGTLGTGKRLNRDSNVLNKKSVVRKSINTENSLIEHEYESIIIKNEVHELSNPSSSDNLLNTTVKLEFDEEIIKESETEKEDKLIETLSTEKSANEDINVMNKKSVVRETINTEKFLIEAEYENIIIKNEVHELSNHSSSDDLLNASIKSQFVGDIIKSDIENACKETLNSKVFHCQLCDTSFQNDTFYSAHMKQHAESNICNVCSKHFKYRKTLITHMERHTKDECVCNVCNKRFKHPRNLTLHLRTHKDEKRYSCKICGKQYKQSSSLVVHMRIHTGQKPFLCSVCDRGFRDSTTLKYHMKTHTKDKPYKCNICGKSMSRKNYLIPHMRIHTGEKPYKCTECNKAFHLSKLLKRHSIIHTGLKPFFCDVCKKSFNQKSTLTVHEKIHLNERTHTCPLCKKSFIDAKRLRYHLQNHK